MDTLIRPLVSERYEVALEIITRMLQKGLISNEEFNKIDDENRKNFIEAITAK